ncbi:MAG: DsbA family protein [Kofleriaceae bacterium]
MTLGAVRRGFVIAMMLATAAHIAHADRMAFDPSAIYRVPRGAGPADGPRDAPVTIVAWSDHACGYCNRVQGTLDQLDRLYPGQLRWVHRTLPLDDDETTAAEASLAANAQGKFRAMNERLYAIGGRVDRISVELIARELGLDMIRFRADLDTRAYRKQIEADVADAHTLGVTGTPTFFVNGRPIQGGQRLKVFVEVIDAELARARSAPQSDYEALVADGRVTADSPRSSDDTVDLDPAQTYTVGLGLPGHQLGPDDAMVTVVVWSDFQCPFCAKAAPVLAQLRDKYGARIRIVFRHLPMAFHRDAALAAEAAIAAADQGKFWAFHDQIFARFGALSRKDLETFAGAAGLDLVRFRAALDDRRYRDLVAVEAASALALGIDGTPTMFINGTPIIGAQSLETLVRMVDVQLGRANAMVKNGVAAKDVYALLMSGARGVERADPARVPQDSVAKLAPRDDERAQIVMAACRRRDGKHAQHMAAGLTGAIRARATRVCATSGIDLAP